MEVSECFEILGLKPGVSMREIRQAYRKLALQHHPDRSGRSESETFRLITDAYNTLRNKQETEEKATQKFSDLYPEEAVELYDGAEALYAARKYEEALGEYEQVVARLPRHENAWKRKGDCFSNLKKHEEALGCYERVIDLGPDSMQGWNLAGVCLLELGKYDDALEYFDMANKVGPQHEAVWNFRGVCLYQMERYGDALESFDRAIKINPKFVPAWRNKGNVLGAMGKEDEARKCMARAKKLH